MNRWPSHSKITCFNSVGDVIAKSKRSRLDLADSLMLWRREEGALFCSVEVITGAKNWNSWSPENVQKIEAHIRYDLEFDGYKVEIERVSKPSKTPCNRPFRWNLKIAADYGD